ncbi:MAG TPA: molybdate ABC transporter substrate-binding protein [Alphaproteobacteria bacterium]|nr:molybdate ABC transporter substrate-binding protein [Alphaproteobacteria bacterium]
MGRLEGNRTWRLAVMVAALAAALAIRPAAAEPVTVFAAASLTDVLREVGAVYEERTGGSVVLSFAASSAIARQVANGAPADLVVSADGRWMDWLEERGLIVAGSRGSRFGNALVLVAPADSAISLEPEPGFPLVQALDGGRLAVGDPDHVPAGRYARQALEALGVWADVERHLARADNVRAALVLVERGEVPLGIVYATDAAIVGGVRVVAQFPAGTHEPIRYPAALVAGRKNPAAHDFLSFLNGPEAAEIFRAYGFAAAP